MGRMLKVGKIINTHGIKGGLKVFPLTDYMEYFEKLDWVYISNDKKKFYIKDIKYMPAVVILFLKGYENINSVEKFKGKYLFIDESQRISLPQNTYYIADIIGLEVYTVKNEYVGKVKDIIQTNSNDIYVIDGKNSKEIMIPAVEEFIPKICVKKGRVIINPIEGMI